MALPGDHHHLQSHTRLRSDARQEHLAGCQRIFHHQWHHSDLLPAAWSIACAAKTVPGGGLKALPPIYWITRRSARLCATLVTSRSTNTPNASSARSSSPTLLG